MRFWLHQLCCPLTRLQNSYFQHINPIFEWKTDTSRIRCLRLYPFQFPFIFFGDFVLKQLFPISNWLNLFFAGFIFIWIIQWRRIFRRKNRLKNVYDCRFCMKLDGKISPVNLMLNGMYFHLEQNLWRTLWVGGKLCDGRDVLRDLKRLINYKFHCKLGRVEVKWLRSIQCTHSTASNSDSQQSA